MAIPKYSLERIVRSRVRTRSSSSYQINLVVKGNMSISRTLSPQVKEKKIFCCCCVFKYLETVARMNGGKEKRVARLLFLSHSRIRVGVLGCMLLCCFSCYSALQKVIKPEHHLGTALSEHER